MTQHFPARQLRFYLTAPAPCPYLPDRLERKVFAHLPLGDGALVNDTLSQSGFRRSQNIAYRPACETCQACISVRIPAADYGLSRSDRRTLNRNADLQRSLVEAEATVEQFDLLSRYLRARHAEGGMTDMGWPDYVAMVEDTPVRTHLIEYRLPSQDGAPGELAACVLVDLLGDGLSMVYSFYDPYLARRSLGRFMILDHLAQARMTGLPYLYLGYWVQGSGKMDYKAGFQPLEALGPSGWRLLGARDRDALVHRPSTGGETPSPTREGAGVDPGV
ncbi:MAG: arginyltransferase [Phenylobacterium sp.]